MLPTRKRRQDISLVDDEVEDPEVVPDVLDVVVTVVFCVVVVVTGGFFVVVVVVVTFDTLPYFTKKV